MILNPKLLPFAKQCAIDRPNTLVHDNKAPEHSHYIQQRVFDAAKVDLLLWCGNEPDLNLNEPAWPYSKRVTTKKGAPKTRQDVYLAWQTAWREKPQEKIQR